ncbi:hypothetical protein GCM10009601_49740 [Streptomyces thermospinosisporus]|uniref:NADP-dependent oxidoreductase domain-containing protein n=1 Tax=Streptomyces thermospinosisporus TaxID=161482 RepID=A0ABN1Z5I1_9ACTN
MPEGRGREGIAFIAFAPLGRGFLSGLISGPQDLPRADGRHRLPRFRPEAIGANQVIAGKVRSVAERLGATAAQVAIAWVLAQGDHVGAIPGTKTLRHLEENVAAGSLALPPDALAELDALPEPVGAR